MAASLFLVICVATFHIVAYICTYDLDALWGTVVTDRSFVGTNHVAVPRLF